MSNYLNGISYPRIEIRAISNNELIDTFDLDLCSYEGGLQEDYAEEFKRIILEKDNKYIDYNNKASRITFTLDYSPYVKASNLMNIEKIFYYNSLNDTYKIILYPRIDILARSFEVRLLDGAYSLRVHSGGTRTIGHKMPVISLVTVTPVGKNFIDASLNYIPLQIKSS